MVTREQDAHPPDADEDANDLGGMVAHMQEAKGEDDDENDGPEIDELRREDRGVAVGKDAEVIPFNVKE